ncbi:MAG: aminotransferase class V-fold PLP-dependent enzyme [Candidatus Pacebacteria bacterium]|nr:aminotransferase class V-fold PLP-dependent enzyme [Candidatus Paceibacterota bacterium]
MKFRNIFPRVIGTDKKIKLHNGKTAKVVLLNNAATTPPFEKTLKKVNTFLETYSAFHRGAGPHAQKTYEAVHESMQTIRDFLQARKDQSMVFAHNTSAVINLFIRLLRLEKGDIILTSDIEHTSNNLPWRFNSKATVIYVNSTHDGALDYKDFEKKILLHKNKVKLVAITGASNLTGYVPNIKKIVRLTHKYNALLFVDAAQLTPHRQIRMKSDGVDALAFSAHKIYAPFGIGVLVLPTSILNRNPVDPGGGSIDMLSEERVVWAPIESRHQTGTWNVTGIVALAESCRILENVGWKNIYKHEAELVSYTVDKLSAIDGITLYISPSAYKKENRIGTITFNLKGYHHALLATILDAEYGIETRAGTICNHRLVRRWFDISDAEQAQIEKEIAKGKRLSSYGIVRASIGIHNTKKDIDVLVQALKNISSNGASLKYRPNQSEEIYEPVL